MELLVNELEEIVTYIASDIYVVPRNSNRTVRSVRDGESGFWATPILTVGKFQIFVYMTEKGLQTVGNVVISVQHYYFDGHKLNRSFLIALIGL